MFSVLFQHFIKLVMETNSKEPLYKIQKQFLKYKLF